MGHAGLIVAFALGTAALAVWISSRFPRLAPQSFRHAIVHVAAAMLLGQIALVSERVSGSPTATLVVLFGLTVPVLVYSFLAALWIFRICQEMLSGALR